MAEKGLLLILSGPSGVGKDSILTGMKELDLPLFFSVTATSRPRRPAEVDGVDYIFIERPRFEEMITRGEFLEWANVYGNLYGVPRQTIEEARSRGQDAIVKVDVQGAATIKSLEPGSISIFIAPPSMEELRSRLVQRKTESGADLDLRLDTARQEMETVPTFDHVVVSHTNRIDDAIREIRAIIRAAKSTPGSHRSEE